MRTDSPCESQCWLMPHTVCTTLLLTVLISRAAHCIRHHNLRGIGLEYLACRLVSELIDHRSDCGRSTAVRDKAVNNIYRFKPVRKVGNDLGGRQVSVRKAEVPAGTIGPERVVSGQ